VPLEQSNIAMLLGSSGVMKRVKIPLKNVCENANSLTLKMLHLRGWHICKGVEELVDGFGLWWILVCISALIQSVLGQAFSWDEYSSE
jgi:hypothetical protein